MSAETEKTITDLSQIQIFEKGPIVVMELLSRDESPGRSLAIIHLDGRNPRVENPESDSLYMVIGGIGYFTLWNGALSRRINVLPGDFVQIPVGTPYQDAGVDLVMVCMSCPAFDGSKVRVLNES